MAFLPSHIVVGVGCTLSLVRIIRFAEPVRELACMARIGLL